MLVKWERVLFICAKELTLMPLPVFKMVVNPDLENETGVQTISFVDRPAIEVDFVYFNKQKEESKVKLAGAEHLRIIATPILIANQLIYRKGLGDDPNFEWLMQYDPTCIAIIKQKFEALGNHASLNFMHLEGTSVKGSLQDSILTKENGIDKALGFDIPKESWFGTIHVEDQDFFNKEILTGNIKGVSIEGLMATLDWKMEAELLNHLRPEKVFIEMERFVAKAEYALSQKTVSYTAATLTRRSTPYDKLLIESLIRAVQSWQRQLRLKCKDVAGAKEMLEKLTKYLETENWDALWKAQERLNYFFD